MEYWRGHMDWPKHNGWKCETCGNASLTWGLVHAQCRCDVCHTQYMMRDENQKVVSTPICMLKPEYKEPARKLWSKYNVPVDEATDEQWDEFTKQEVTNA